MDNSALFLVIDVKGYITMLGVAREYLKPLRSRHLSVLLQTASLQH